MLSEDPKWERPLGLGTEVDPEIFVDVLLRLGLVYARPIESQNGPKSSGT